MTISLSGKTVVVTGGAVRVGRAIATACAEAGANVAITYNHSQQEAHEAVEELQRAHPAAQFACFQAELSHDENVQRLTKEVVAHFGRVDALVNNAAIFRRTPWEELSEADFDVHIASNLKAPYLLAKRFGDVFLEQGSGAIVNIADIHGLRPLKNYIPYCISKAGVITLTQALAKALAPHVRVNCICPGTILPPSETQGESDEYSDDLAQLVQRIPMQRIGSPHDIAETVVFLIGGPGFITGAVLPVDGAESLR